MNREDRMHVACKKIAKFLNDIIPNDKGWALVTNIEGHILVLASTPNEENIKMMLLAGLSSVDDPRSSKKGPEDMRPDRN